MVQADLTLLNLVEIELNWRKLKVCGNAELSKATGPFFPTTFAHLMFLCHFGNSHNISNPPPAKR